jgi:hypothetical protein
VFIHPQLSDSCVGWEHMDGGMGVPTLEGVKWPQVSVPHLSARPPRLCQTGPRPQTECLQQQHRNKVDQGKLI